MKGIFAGIASSVRNMPNDKYRQYCEAVSTNQQITDELLSLLRRIRTSLDRFNRIEIEALIYHAYSLTAAFAWCYRDSFSDRYRGVGLSDSWKIDFDTGIIASWKSELEQAAKAFDSADDDTNEHYAARELRDGDLALQPSNTGEPNGFTL